jgi:hypothetical protein
VGHHGTIPSRRVSWEFFVHYTLRVGETLGGPSSSVVFMVLPFMYGLLGTGTFGCLERGRAKTEGAMMAAHHRFCHFAIAFIFPFLDKFVLLPSISFVSNYYIDVVAIY